MTAMPLNSDVTPHLLETLLPRQMMRWLVPAALLLAVVGYIAVEISFASVQFPGTLFQAQLAFDAQVVKAQYGILLSQGTMPLYIRTQWIDFVFISGLALAGFVGHVALARTFPVGSRGYRITLLLGMLFVIGAGCDALENVTGFLMLADPLNFPDGLAVIYSTFAAIKWSLAGVGIVTVVLELVAFMIRRGSR